MISTMLGLFRATYIANNSSHNLTFGNNILSKSAQLHRAQNATMYKIAIEQQNQYRKLLNKNIENSFNIFA